MFLNLILAPKIALQGPKRAKRPEMGENGNGKIGIYFQNQS